MKRVLTGVTAAILLLLAGLPIAYLNWPARTPVLVPINQGAEIGGAFALQDHDGKAVTDQTFNGRWTLVFFGFTHCPDICPTTLMDIAKALQALGEKAAQIQPLFITLDPERDTPDMLAAYVDHFDQRILGLSGTLEQTQQVADVYKIYFKKVPMGDNYTIDHSTTIYLMGPDGKFMHHFSQPRTVDNMVQEIASLLDAN